MVLEMIPSFLAWETGWMMVNNIDRVSAHKKKKRFTEEVKNSVLPRVQSCL